MGGKQVFNAYMQCVNTIVSANEMLNAQMIS